MRTIYEYLDLMSLEHATNALYNFDRIIYPNSHTVVYNPNTEYNPSTLLHGHIEKHYDKNPELMTDHLHGYERFWQINPIVYAYVYQQFLEIQNKYIDSPDDTNHAMNRYHNLADRKGVKSYWCPYNGCYRGYIFVMNENREINLVTEDDFDQTDSEYFNENFPHIQEFFKGKRFVQFIQSNDKFIMLTTDNKVFIYGRDKHIGTPLHYKIHRPIPFYPLLIYRPIHIDHELLVDYDGRIWLWNPLNLFALRGYKYFLDRLESFRMLDTLHIPHLLFELDDEFVYCAKLEKTKGIRYWNRKGEEHFLEFSHRVIGAPKQSYKDNDFLYEKGLLTDYYFSIDVQQIYSKDEISRSDYE
jgi:hypothetical protein